MNQKSALNILLATAAVALLGTGIYFALPIQITPPVLNPTPTPIPPASPTPTSPLPETGQPMSVAELWNKHSELVGKSVVVKDIISFETNCLSVEPPDANSCERKVRIGPHPPQTDYLKLLRAGQYVACTGSGQTCDGFEQGKTYTIPGTLVKCDYQNLGFCLETS